LLTFGLPESREDEHAVGIGAKIAASVTASSGDESMMT
jgi:hypothetical protein